MMQGLAFERFSAKSARPLTPQHCLSVSPARLHPTSSAKVFKGSAGCLRGCTLVILDSCPVSVCYAAAYLDQFAVFDFASQDLEERGLARARGAQHEAHAPLQPKPKSLTCCHEHTFEPQTVQGQFNEGKDPHLMAGLKQFNLGGFLEDRYVYKRCVLLIGAESS